MSAEQQGTIAAGQAGSCRRLADVLNLTRDMLDYATADDWDRVAELEKMRRADLQACFSSPVIADQRELVAEALAVMLHLNEELMGKLATARELVLKRGAQQARTRSAIHNYHDVGQAPA
ncbi:MAG: hypothetical protein ACI87W_001271 [Halieaceae bacterium]|jgi:hypothetical protein